MTDAGSAARYTGMSPSTLEAYPKGGGIYGVSFRPGAWRCAPEAAFLVNPTRELVAPGGAALPAGSTLFKLGEHGAWTPLKRF